MCVFHAHLEGLYPIRVSMSFVKDIVVGGGTNDNVLMVFRSSRALRDYVVASCNAVLFSKCIQRLGEGGYLVFRSRLFQATLRHFYGM